MWNKAIENGGVAVITDGASGVGLAMARQCAMHGLSIVLADTSESVMAKAARTLSDLGTDIRTVKTDVSDVRAVHNLADIAFEMGPVAVLMNNAGIARPTKSWDNPDNWRRMLEVNLFGVLNGVQAFLPRMIAADRPAVVINTGSKQGITTPPGNPGYNVSKAGLRVMTEMLAHELHAAKAPISAHMFVPGFTYTGMISSWLPEKPDAAWTPEDPSHIWLNGWVAVNSAFCARTTRSRQRWIAIALPGLRRTSSRTALPCPGGIQTLPRSLQRLRSQAPL